MPDDVKADLNKAKIDKNVNVEQLDGKISASFNVTDNSDGNWKSRCWDKIFDQWQDFNDYCDSFFTNDLKI